MIFYNNKKAVPSFAGGGNLTAAQVAMIEARKKGRRNTIDPVEALISLNSSMKEAGKRTAAAKMEQARNRVSNVNGAYTQPTTSQAHTKTPADLAFEKVFAENRRAVEARAEEAIRQAGEKKDTNKTPAVKAPAVKAPVKDSPAIARIKRIQNLLGVKEDGKWGPKTIAAANKIKEVQRALGFTGADIDGIPGKEFRKAITMRDIGADLEREKQAASMGSSASDASADIAAAARSGAFDNGMPAGDTFEIGVGNPVYDRRAASRRIGGLFYCTGQ